MVNIVYNVSALAYPHTGVILDEAIQSAKSGNRVLYVYCDGLLSFCFKNPSSNEQVCRTCRRCSLKYKNELERYGVEVIGLKRTKARRSEALGIVDSETLKGFKYNGVSIGYSLASVLISLERKIDFQFYDDSIRSIELLAHEGMDLVDELSSVIDSFGPSMISLYNGRFLETRPMLELGVAYGCDVRVLEVVGQGISSDPFKVTAFKNGLPHDIDLLAERVQQCWENSTESELSKKQKGGAFYQKKRDRLATGLIDFTEHQQKGLLPSDWDKARRNIVIFNSSEDEFAAIGEEFDRYSLFSSQYEGIKYILENSNNSDLKFYLRIHPNLKGVQAPFHEKLIGLEAEYRNLTVIKAEDPACSYSLLDAADKIVVFGSTVGIEAVFWKKPVVLLGGAMYYKLGGCYTPKSPSEAIKLIDSDLSAIASDSAVKYGFYVLDRDVLAYDTINTDLKAKSIKIGQRKLKHPVYFKSSYFDWGKKLLEIWRLHVLTKMYKDKISPKSLFSSVDSVLSKK